MQEMQSVTQFVSRLRLTRREVTMELILDTQPYMLYETIAMLTKYVNRISMLDIRDTLLRLYRSGLDETWRRRLECLQEILEQVCADVDREDPDMQYFFSKRELSGPSDLTNLARVLTHPFIEWRSPKLEEEAEALKEGLAVSPSARLPAGPRYMRDFLHSLPAGEAQESFFRQLYRLHLPGDLSMEVLNLYEDYTGNLDRLVGLITPLRPASGGAAGGAPLADGEPGGPIGRSNFKPSPRSPFCAGSKMGYRSPPVNPHRRVCFSLMACTELQFETQNSVLHPGRSLYVFGCSIAAVCSQQMFGDDTEHIAATFRTLGNKKPAGASSAPGPGPGLLSAAGGGGPVQHRRHVPQPHRPVQVRSAGSRSRNSPAPTTPPTCQPSPGFCRNFTTSWPAARSGERCPPPGPCA